MDQENNNVIVKKLFVRAIIRSIVEQHYTIFNRIDLNQNNYNKSGVTMKIEKLFATDNNLYIFHEFLDYKTLQQIIDEGIDKIKYDRKIFIVYNLAQSLNILHSKKLMHRNLTP